MALNAVIASVMAIATAQVALASYSHLCYPPIGPEYGGYTPKEDHYSIGYTIEYFCDEGYVLVGDETAECVYDDETETAIFSSIPVCECEYMCRIGWYQISK